MITYYQFIHISCNSWRIIICNYYAVVFKGEVRFALRTFPPLRYSMLHYVRAVSNITTIVVDADDSLQVIMAAFTLGPVLFRILANRTRRVDFASGLHSHYKRLTRRERYAPTSPCTHCVCFATGCNPITCT